GAAGRRSPHRGRRHPGTGPARLPSPDRPDRRLGGAGGLDGRRPATGRGAEERMSPPHPAPASLRRDPAGGPARRPTRVLHVITHLDNGGAQANTLLSVAGLDRSRHQVDLAAGPGVLESDALASADRLVVLPYFRRSLYSLGDLRAAVALLRLVGD